ncbi:hypothetical protein C0V82_19915 [Niveispirillum cyanobacteriorum]|uniref:Uncharacterized protein n=1 Tax=Niveispirillum cyanobacteriorum TaxID=1612173 RepID=A0A2K9NHQ6_9PROT|nr:hypothetical protein C0V82_19915 [Niveispirillum cyanobacteriorum]
MGAFNSGGFIVAFSHEATAGTDYNIFARSYKPDGTAWGNPIQLNQYTSSFQTNASVVGGANGHSLVVWQSNNQDGSGYGIYGRFVLFTSGASGSEFRINSTTASNQAGPVLTALPNGDYLVVWVSTNQDATTGLGIFGQRVDASGNLVGGEFQVNTYVTGDQNGPSVTNLADGGWLITWQSQGQDGDGLGLYGQRYDSTGNRVGDEFQLHQWVGGDQRNVSVDARADGGWNLVWLNEAADGTFDVHMRIFAPTDAAPTLVATDQNVGVNGRVGATALFDLVDDVASGIRPAGDHPVSSYEFTDNAAGGGYFTVSGVQQASGTPFTVSTDLLHTVQWIAAADVATEQVQIRAFDGVNWSAPVTANINTTAPALAFVETGLLRANTTTTNNETNPQAVELDNGTIVVVWQTAAQGIVGQRYSAAGGKLGSEFVISPSSTGSVINPAIASMVDGGFVVSWTIGEGDTSGNAIHARRYDGDGSPMAAAFRVNTTTAGDQELSSITGLSNGGYAVAFTHRVSTTDYDVHVRVYGPEGGRGTDIKVNQYSGSFQTNVRVTAGSNGDFLVSWQSSGQDGSGYGVYGRLMSADGYFLGSEFQINQNTSDNQVGPAITALKDGGYQVIWLSLNQDGSSYGVYGMHLDGKGQPTSGENLINTYTIGSQSGAEVVALADGGWLVAWHSENQDGSGYGIYAQRFDMNGASVGTEFRMNNRVGGDQKVPAIAARTDGGWVAFWDDVGLDGYGSGIYGRFWGHAVDAPVLVATDKTAFAGSDIAGLELFDVAIDAATATVPGGEHKIVTYEFTDNNAGGGQFLLQGAGQASGTPFTVSASQMPYLKWVVGSGAETVQVRAFDGERWSAPVAVTINGTTAPEAFAVTGETRANPVHTGGDPDVAVLKDGSYVFVWTSNDEGTTVNGPTRGVYAQRYAADGSKLGGEFRVNANYEGDQDRPSIAALEDGSYFVTWHGSGSWDLFGRRFSANGTALTGDLNIAPGDSAFQNRSEVAALSNGGYVYAFEDYDYSGPTGYDIAIRVFNANNVAQNQSYKLNQYLTGNQTSVDVAGGIDGTSYVIWQSAGQDGSGAGIYGRLVDRFGSPLTNETHISVGRTAGDQTLPAISALAGGGYIAAWSSQGYDGAGYGVVLRFIDAAGQLIGDEFIGNTSNTYDQLEVSVAGLADGGFIVGWVNHGDATAGGSPKMFAQRFDKLGAKVGAEFPVSNTNGDAQDYHLSIAARTDGGWVTAWQASPLTDPATYTFTRAWGDPNVMVNDFVEQTGTAGDDGLSGTPYRDKINGLGGNDVIYGLGSDDSLIGGNGDDYLDGGTGNDTLVGGAGNDVFKVDSLSDVVVEAAGAGNDTVYADISGVILAANIENMFWVGTGNFEGTGNSQGNSIRGGAGDDTLNGGGGADTLVGGEGNDTYIVDNANDLIEDFSGIDTVQTTLSSYTLAYGLEHLVYTGSGNFNGKGSLLDGSVVGGAGNDTLSGEGGTDTLIGGAGNDTYTTDSTDDLVIELAGGGIDTLRTQANTYALSSSAEIENLTFIGAGNFTGTGSNTANSISGGTGSDTLDGAGGVDTLAGGAGDDHYLVDDVADLIVEASGAGTDQVIASVAAYTLSANVENLSYNGMAAFAGTGNALANLIDGGIGADTLDGGSGADTLNGGAGDDLYIIDNAGDVAVEAAGGGTDSVHTTLDAYTLGTDVENLTYTGGGTFTGTGNASANLITGGTGADTLAGLGGIDTLEGGAGDDLYDVEETGDQVVELAGGGNDHVRSSATVYTLSAEIETLTFTGSGTFTGTGNALANSIKGGAGNDTLDGAAGADTLDGGDGDDTYAVDDAGDTIIDSAGTDTVRSSLAAYTLGAGLEHLVFNGTGAFAGTGNAAGNSITGGSGSDTLDGGAGADTLAGGTGNDTYIVDDVGDVVADTGGIDTVRTALASHILAANIENLVFTGTGDFSGTGNGSANSITGSTGNDTLDGLGGNDTLDGGVGADSMAGGLGNDTFIVDDAGDVVVEAAGGGTDTVRTSLASYTLGTDVEHLVFTGTGAFTGTGNGANNSITGGTGNDTLDGLDGDDTLSGGNGNDSLTGGNGNDNLTGGTGADTMVGGAGNDTYIVDNIGDVVVEQAGEGTDSVQSSINFTLASVLENLTLTGGAAINGVGNDGDNLLTGNGAANSLEGGLGNDSLNGGGGADTLVGGAGDDLYTIDNAGDIITELAGEGTDGVQSSVTYTLSAHVENLTLTGSGAVNATGNDLVNILTGNSAANRLDGGTGADTMAGGAGDDVYVVDDVGDTITETVGQGTDRLETALAAYTLGINLEHLTYTGSGDFTGTGNAAANSITGGAGNDTLDGGAGADTLAGGAGNDFYIIDDSADVISEGAGNGVDTAQVAAASYTLSANVEAMTFTGSGDFTGTGNATANSITGGTGNDTLDGGAGADTLAGGAGADRFVVDDGDIVADFSSAEADKLDLTSLDADSGTAGIQSFIWIDTTAFSGVAGELRWVVAGSDVKLLADRDGDGDADLEVTLTGVASISNAELVL